jgi:hypothetical protein
VPGSKFDFRSMGVGSLLRQGRLDVPPNQRSYAWEERHVRILFEDLNEAITNSQDDYFLGTVVIVQAGTEIGSIADGQQRIATLSIFLARVRDHLTKLTREGSARSVDYDFLRNIDRDTEAIVPRIKLNLEDNDFFVRRILPGPLDSNYAASQKVEPVRASNARLKMASEIAVEFIGELLTPLPPQSHAEHLLRWVKFIELNAGIVVVTVPDEIGAFRIFETMNDRGLKASQADILKNYFFSKAGSRLTEALAFWNAMTGAVEGLGEDENERLVTYIRHLWITTHGPTKERELAAEIKKEVTGETRTMQFVADASASVQDYVALWSSRHPKWSVDYKSSVKQNIETLAVHLQVEQIRPLLFAVARHFNPQEADGAFRLFVSWSVRFLIYGGRGGMLDLQYSLRAQDVGSKRITKARELRDAMERYVPTDTEFEEAFATARVSRPHLARYYLRALEKSLKSDPQPEYVANEEVTEINLEHVLPLSPGKDWNVDNDVARAAQRLLGNMVLLRANQNRDIGNKSFVEKCEIFKNSGYYVTQQVSEYSEWKLDDIRKRQAALAKIAVRTWPLTFGD